VQRAAVNIAVRSASIRVETRVRIASRTAGPCQYREEEGKNQTCCTCGDQRADMHLASKPSKQRRSPIRTLERALIFQRPTRIADAQAANGAALADAAEAPKHRGYRRVVLAGQPFGAFISLIVIATAPAAYGSAESNPSGFAQNATGLSDLLGAVRHARVALFFFERDVFDPGGRGPNGGSDPSWHGLTHVVVDRPPGWRPIGPPPVRRSLRSMRPILSPSRLATSSVHLTGLAGPAWRGSHDPHLVSVLRENSTSVIDLKIGRRVDVSRALGRR
jgi:hypothetical protein